jgi:hypothetical protein
MGILEVCKWEGGLDEQFVGWLSTRRSLPYPFGQFTYLLVANRSLLHAVLYFVRGVYDRAVISATELFADLGEGEIGQLPAQVHGDLTSFY